MKRLDNIFYGLQSNKNLYESLSRNLDNILNTRSSLSCSDFISSEFLSSIYFGVPSFTHLSMNSKKDKEILCISIEKAIVNFENRLQNVMVEFCNYDNLKKEAKIVVFGEFLKNEVVVNLVLKVVFWEFLVNVKKE
ncbi:MAG: type VI secretion system baseplate subunit TssE [Spirobacillus cienkowskii]|jgi:type VI secretion system lysozyme-like protein|uniref:Type VI secretion system baseplate subunit TssE n=1 Tax=Spirobacillus cienkowskii TaxID=495820 RepID=A0A369KS15_9BACT|nr:MAG: type VI secretion system baseplate subunit TssE [Spirobacillus cienkowskii]